MENEKKLAGSKPVSPSIKLILLAVMAILLLIPQFFIELLVDSRRTYSEEVQGDIAQSWGREQVVRPLWLTLDVIKSAHAAKQEKYVAFFQADSAYINVKMTTSKRQRGFYSATLYHAIVSVDGYFSSTRLREELQEAGYKGEDVSSSANLCTAIDAPLGLKSDLKVKMGDREYSLRSRSLSSITGGTNFSASIDLNHDSLGKFSYTYEFNGYKDLSFEVLSSSMQVDLELQYPSPAFLGDYIPDDFTISKEGLTKAHWKLMSGACLFPKLSQREAGSRYYEFDDDSPKVFSVRTQFTDVYYRAIERSLKYAILIIIFTFLTFFFTDTLSKTNMPMIGYLLTGFAIMLFYTLLLSISEYISFGWAYLITSFAIIAMIGVYFWSFVRSYRATGLCVGILAILYTFLYIILQMDTFPLLVGSVFLFIVLGLVMYLSRKLTW